MGRPTPQQMAGLNILDWLYFNQVLVYSVFSDEQLCCLHDIVKQVKAAVTATGATDVEAEVMKHYVLCYLEILVSDADLPGHPEADKVMRHSKLCFSGMLMGIGEGVRDYSSAEAFSIAEGLMTDVLSAPVAVRFRLAERCLAFEYPSAAHECLMWLAESEAVKCAKYKFGSKPSKLHEPVIARIGLLCEFELTRNAVHRGLGGRRTAESWFHSIASELPPFQKNLVSEAGKLWLEKFHCVEPCQNTLLAFFVDRAFDKKYVATFLINVNLHWSRHRFCPGTSASWVGIIGAFHMVLLKRLDDLRPIYSEGYPNADTLANAAKGAMQRFGLSILGRTLYLRYREFDKQIRPRLVNYYTHVNSSDRVISAEIEDPWYVICGVVQERSISDNADKQNTSTLAPSR